MEKPACVYRPKFNLAAKVAKRLREDYGLKPESFEAGIVLGTGFGDSLSFGQVLAEIPMEDIPDFHSLQRYDLPGHARRIVVAELGGKLVITQRGRVHLNEDPDDDRTIRKMVRLQIELMFHLGVKRLILTSAVGSLGREKARFQVGEICVVDSLITKWLITKWFKQMPLYSGEFHNPEQCLDAELRAKAIAAAAKADLVAKPGTHLMYLGPWFETPQDRILMAEDGGHVVGMSILPECCFASLYNIPTVALACITDSELEKPDHEMHTKRMRAISEQLGRMLTSLVESL